MAVPAALVDLVVADDLVKMSFVAAVAEGCLSSSPTQICDVLG